MREASGVGPGPPRPRGPVQRTFVVAKRTGEVAEQLRQCAAALRERAARAPARPVSVPFAGAAARRRPSLRHCAIATRKVPELAPVRRAFVGRALHRSPPSWRATGRPPGALNPRLAGRIPGMEDRRRDDAARRALTPPHAASSSARASPGDHLPRLAVGDRAGTGDCDADVLRLSPFSVFNPHRLR